MWVLFGVHLLWKPLNWSMNIIECTEVMTFWLKMLIWALTQESWGGEFWVSKGCWKCLNEKVKWIFIYWYFGQLCRELDHQRNCRAQYASSPAIHWINCFKWNGWEGAILFNPWTPELVLSPKLPQNSPSWKQVGLYKIKAFFGTSNC
jgi:hypothetical protein